MIRGNRGNDRIWRRFAGICNRRDRIRPADQLPDRAKGGKSSN